MELRQLRYFVSIVELGSMGKAALDAGVATAALSQQISRLEKELGVRLLLRQAKGASPTPAGMAFYRRAQLILRHTDEAAIDVRHARLSGSASLGLTPAAAALLGGPLLQSLRERYPQVRLRLVEAFSGHLTQMLNTRRIDSALLFQSDLDKAWHCDLVLKESLFAVSSPACAHALHGRSSLQLRDLDGVPLLLPSRAHGLRVIIDAAFAHAGITPQIGAEIDSLTLLMEAVRLGYGVAIQQSAVAARPPVPNLAFARLTDPGLRVQSMLVTLAADEASPAVAVTGKLLVEVAQRLVREHQWLGAELNGPGLSAA